MSSRFLSMVLSSSLSESGRRSRTALECRVAHSLRSPYRSGTDSGICDDDASKRHVLRTILLLN
jgi:hypothetical protein